MVQKLKDQVDALPSIREATVASSDPLAVRFDTDTVSVQAFASLVGVLAVGERVLTLRLSRYVWVLGRRGGARGEPWAVARGSYMLSGLAPSEPGSATIVFPVGRFPIGPAMHVDPDTSVPWNVDVSAGSVTAAGFTLYGRRTDATDAIGVWWSATLMTPTSREG